MTRPAHRFPCALACWFWIMTGCSTAPFTTVTILDTPSAFVRLETDRNVDRDDAQHTHPVTFTVEQMAGILGGIMIEEPFARMPLYEDTRQPRRHPALTEKEVAFFAPLLALALAKATPEEIVTFYQTRDLSGTSREVTSGGLFVQGEEVHILLANYRSSTYFVADVGVAGTTDDRLTPLRPLAPQRVVLDFEPRSAKREAPVSIWDKLMQKDRRDLVVFFSLVPPRPLHQPPSAPPAR